MPSEYSFSIFTPVLEVLFMETSTLNFTLAKRFARPEDSELKPVFIPNSVCVFCVKVELSFTLKSISQLSILKEGTLSSAMNGTVISTSCSIVFGLESLSASLHQNQDWLHFSCI